MVVARSISKRQDGPLTEPGATTGTSNFIVVGSGPAGLTAALSLVAATDRKVILIEPQAEIGGLWRSFRYGADACFDYGMHNIFDCGDARIDGLLAGLLPPDQWVRLEGANRDVAGVFYGGRLQTNSPSIDLRRLPEETRQRMAGEILQAAVAPAADTVPSCAAEQALKWWGHAVTQQVIAPVMRKLFGHPLEKLDLQALRLTALSRVILFDADPMRDLMRSERLRERLAFPDQKRLPLEYSGGRVGRYPVQGGMQRTVDAIRERLLARGAEITTETKIVGVETEQDRITALRLETRNGPRLLNDVGSVFWGAGLAAAFRATQGSAPQASPDPPARLTVVNLVVDAHSDAGGLHYFYCYDAGHPTFRVTLYANFVNAPSESRRITIELIGVDAAKAIDTALAELRHFGILAEGARPTYAAVEDLGPAFPMPTVANEAAAQRNRAAIDSMNLSNFHLIGQAAKPRLFFQGEVLRDLAETLRPYLPRTT